MNQAAIEKATEFLVSLDHHGNVTGRHFCREKAIKAVIKQRDLGFIYDLETQQYFSVNRHGETERFDMSALKKPAESAPDRHGVEE